MKDFFIFIETTQGPHWIRSSEITAVIPAISGTNCRISLKRQIHSEAVTYNELEVEDESAEELITRLENQHIARIVNCQKCGKENTSNALTPICHACRKASILYKQAMATSPDPVGADPR
jgi:hypothetical protein